MTSFRSNAGKSPKSRTREAPDASHRLEQIVHWSDDAIISKDLDGTITTWNGAAERIFGYTAEEAVGRSILLIIPEDRRQEEDEVLRRVAAGEVVHHFETMRVRKDGKLVDVSLTVSPIKDRAGRIIGASKIARDISANLQLRREQARLEKDSARILNEFLSMLAHELRTPLGSILGWSELLLKNELDVAQTREGLDTIRRNALTQSKLLGDLMDLSRISHGLLEVERRPVNVERTIQAAIDVVLPLAMPRRIEIQLHRSGEVFFVQGDGLRLEQVFWNVLTNAVKFTPQAGRIDLHLRRAGAQIRTTIRDTGIGIRAEFIPNVFTKFRQGENGRVGSPGGLGLGMALVREMVELHKGAVRVESGGDGKGTTVTIDLPELRAIPTEKAIASGPVNRARVFRDLRILVVDDRPDDSRLLKLILERTGAVVQECDGAAKAAAAIEAWRPDVLISDLAMGQEGGLALIERVRALKDPVLRLIPAIAVSAHGDGVREHALQAGFHEFLVKPVEAETLLPTIIRIRMIVEAG